VARPLDHQAQDCEFRVGHGSPLSGTILVVE
jgi:hypothetical protein